MSDDLNPGGEVPEKNVPFLEGIANIIHEIDLKVLEYKRSIGNTITKVLEGNGRIKDYINLSVLLAMGVMQGLLLSSNAQWADDARTAIRYIRTKVSTFFNAIGVQLLLSTHKLLASVWADYRKMFEGISNAAAGLSESLGLGLEFLPMAMMNIQGMVTAGASIFGVPPEEVEIRFLSIYASFLDKWDNKFDTYARNPGAILDDLNNWITDHAYRENQRKWRTFFSGLNTVTNVANQAASGVLALEGSFNKLLTDLPAEQFQVIQEWYEPIHEEIAGYRAQYLEPALTFLNDLTDEIDKRTRSNDVTLEELQGALANIPIMLFGAMTDKGDRGKLFRNLFSQLVDMSQGLTSTDVPDDIAQQLESSIVNKEVAYTPIEPGTFSEEGLVAAQPLPDPPTDATYFFKSAEGLLSGNVKPIGIDEGEEKVK